MRELLVDNFAGGGGASLGIEMATGRAVDIAINHNAEAIAMHAANHPHTVHLQEDVWKVDPVQACAGRPVGLAWFSPDCTHFSKAKGGKPRSKKIRGLAWVVIRWAKSVKPRIICLENVEEFKTWGPLSDGRPCPRRKGQTFTRWVNRLRRLGYKVEWRELVAADYGAPTTRKRLFLIARCDGQPIVWPEPTHAKDPGAQLHTMHLAKWRSAAECIDFSLPCPSIFERKKPLATATEKRIAQGIRRFVLESAQPFLVEYHSAKRPGDDRVRSLGEPLPTQTVENRFAVAAPMVVGIDNQSSGEAAVWSGEEPARTITAENRFAVAAPVLVQTGYGEREGQAPRALDLGKPLGTAVASGKHALAAAFLAKHYGGVVGQEVERPLGTVTAVDHHSLVATHLTKFYGQGNGAPVEAPMPTVMGQHNHLGEVRAFLTKYYGTGGGQDCGEPMATVTSKDRMGLVMVQGEAWQIVDIGLRMLQPRELARAQGFPDSYVLTGSKTSQVARIGNSVCPPLAAAIVRANYRERMAAEVAA